MREADRKWDNEEADRSPSPAIKQLIIKQLFYY